MKKLSYPAVAGRRLVLCLLLFFFALNAQRSTLHAAGPTLAKDIDISGANSKISSGTFNASAATVIIGTLTTGTNANAIIDPNGTGAIDLLAKIYVGATATAPTALLHLAAGTAAAGTAPLKLEAGALLTTPESGAVNYDGSFFYVTSSTPTRQRISTDAATNAIAASAIDWSLSGTHSKTLAANTTFTFSNAIDGKTIVVALTNTAGNFTVTWPTVSWTGGTAPVQTVGAKTDVYTLVKIGSIIYGSVVQNF